MDRFFTNHFTLLYTRRELIDRPNIAISLTVYNIGEQALYCTRGTVEKRLPIPPISPTPTPGGPGDIRL